MSTIPTLEVSKVSATIRITQASGTFGRTTHQLLCNKRLIVRIRKQLFYEIVTNQLLWGFDAWATIFSDINAIRVICDKLIRIMLTLTLCAMKETDTSMDEVRK